MKKFLVTWFMSLFFALMLALPCTELKAEEVYYDPVVNDVVQTAAAPTSMTIQASFMDCVAAKVYILDEAACGSDYVYVGEMPVSTDAYTISNLTPGSVYWVKVVGIAPDGEESYNTNYECVTTINKLEDLKQDRWYHYVQSVDISWKNYTAHPTVEYKITNGKNKVVDQGKTNTSSLTFYCKPYNLYTVRARACVPFNGQEVWSEWSEVTCIEQTFPTKVSINKNKKTLNIKWKKTAGATGYEIWASTKPQSGFKKIKTLGKNKTSYTIKKIKGKKLNVKKPIYFYIATKKGKNTSGVVYLWNSKKSVDDFYYKQ